MLADRLDRTLPVPYPFRASSQEQATVVTTNPQSITSLSVPKTRILDAALELFSERGAAGTSLQMIANAVGVTKAAVYHQFRSKDEIMLAVGKFIYDRLEEIAELAEAEPSPRRAREVLVDELIALAVENRRVAGFLQRDPIMLQLFEEHEPFRRVMDHLNSVLMGKRAAVATRVTVAMLVTAIGGAVMHPLVADVDNETLRTQLQKLAHCLVGSLK
jgi:AcrR family transcriptional regulator